MPKLKNYTIRFLETEITFITDQTKPSSLIGVLRALFREAHKKPGLIDDFMKTANEAYRLSQLPKSKAADVDEKLDFDFWDRMVREMPGQH